MCRWRKCVGTGEPFVSGGSELSPHALPLKTLLFFKGESRRAAGGAPAAVRGRAHVARWRVGRGHQVAAFGGVGGSHAVGGKNAPEAVGEERESERD